MRIPALLSLLTLFVVPAASKLRPNHGMNQGKRQLQDRTTFQSFFDIDYLTDGTQITDFNLIAQALAEAYNDLTKQGYSDPYNRSMDTVEVVDTSTTPTQSPNSNLNAFLRVTGSCDGCPSDSQFTYNTVRRNLKFSKKKKSSKSGGKGGKWKSIKPPLKSQKSQGKGHSHDTPMVPTEEQLRVAYTAAIQRLDTGILDVVRLDEVDSMPSDGSYDEGAGNGGYSGKGSVECPAIGGSFTGTFTSYFMATYEVVRNTDDDVPAAVAAFSDAYNTVIMRYEADITMEEASIYDPASGRRLSLAEFDLQRKLQYHRPYYISVTGRCTGCSRSFTFANQVSGRRQLSTGGQCLRPGLPTENELNAEYNIELDRLNLPNVLSCLQLDEIEKPTMPEGKGGGKGGSSSTSGKGTKSGIGHSHKKSGKGGKLPKSAKAAKSPKKRTRR